MCFETVDFEPSDSLTPCQSAILPSRWGEWIVMVPKIHISQYVRGNNEFPQNILFNDLSFLLLTSRSLFCVRLSGRRPRWCCPAALQPDCFTTNSKTKRNYEIEKKKNVLKKMLNWCFFVNSFLIFILKWKK